MPDIPEEAVHATLAGDQSIVEVVALSRLAAHEERWGRGSLATFREQARRDLDALAGEGLVVVPAADIVLALANPAGLTRMREFAAHINAKDDLLAVARPVLEAQTERSADA